MSTVKALIDIADSLSLRWVATLVREGWNTEESYNVRFVLSSTLYRMLLPS